MLTIGRKKDVKVGFLAGALGGLVASLAMDAAQIFWNNASFALTGADPSGKPPRSGGLLSRGYQSQGGKGGYDANEIAASTVVKRLTGRSLSHDQKQWAGPLMHYAFGMVLGGGYGMAAELRPELGAGAGLPVGAVMWLVQDEIGVPLAGLAKEADKYPLGLHLYGFVTHLVYAAALEATRRAVRSLQHNRLRAAVRRCGSMTRLCLPATLPKRATRCTYPAFRTNDSFVLGGRSQPELRPLTDRPLRTTSLFVRNAGYVQRVVLPELWAV